MFGAHDKKSGQARDNASYRKQVAREAKAIAKAKKKAAKKEGK